MKKWLLKKVFSVKLEVCDRWNDVSLSIVREKLCVFGVLVYCRYREANYSDIEMYLGI
ncbi:hypothetical protein ACQ1PN_12015 [Ornithobacterium rhinotracheale]